MQWWGQGIKASFIPMPHSLTSSQGAWELFTSSDHCPGDWTGKQFRTGANAMLISFHLQAFYR